MKELIKNEIYEALIEGYSSEGAGVCRIEGRAVFVPRTIKGERWRVKIVKVTASAVYARAAVPLLLSPERQEPECPYSTRCGGCVLQHMSYEEENRFKLARVNDALRRIAHSDVQAEEILGSERVCRYRNKGIYAVREVDGTPRSGFFAPRSHELVPVDGCLIQAELADRCALAVTQFMRENGIEAYDEQALRGSVRHVFVRTALNTGDAVACIVSAHGFGAKTAALTAFLREKCPELTGIVLNINKSAGNTVLAGDFYTLWGSDVMRDSLGGIEYEISPQAFYQVNPKQAERLYERALLYAEPDNAEVLDMYCGAGTISLYLAKRARLVTGAEIIPEAVENARANAARNGIENARFICADASEAAQQLLAAGTRPEVIVTDPPRKGMSKDAIRALCSMSPERVVYVSCNPATLARDITVFDECGYTLSRATAVDMFPRTTHVECVVQLSCKIEK